MSTTNTASKPLKDHYDLVVIGGGINGTSVARAASKRGLSTLLCQANDLATGYSSANPYFLSPNMADLKQIRLGRLAKTYRQIDKLRNLAPHLLQPCAAVENFKPGWSWPLLNGIHRVWQEQTAMPEGMQSWLPQGLVHKPVQGYRLADFRFTIANACAARDAGAHIAVNHELLSGQRQQGLWQLRIRAQSEQAIPTTVETPILINATGPHVQQVLNTYLQSETRAGVQVIRMTHLVLPNRVGLNTALFYHTEDGQRLGLTPINERWLHFGPLTQAKESADPDQAIEQARQTLLARLNQLTGQAFTDDDIAQCRSGLRAICDGGSGDDLSDLVLDLDCPDGQSPLINMLGGDVLHHRLNAAQTMRLLSPYLPNHAHPPEPITTLPGGEFSNIKTLTAELKASHPHLPDSLLNRLRDTYGEESFSILGNAKTTQDLGRDFGHGLHEAEVNYLVENEWACTAADILERRSGLSWDFSAAQASSLDEYLRA